MATEEEVVDFLEHFGIKGMRWGFSKRKNVSAGTAIALMAGFVVGANIAKSLLAKHGKTNANSTTINDTTHIGKQITNNLRVTMSTTIK